MKSIFLFEEFNWNPFKPKEADEEIGRVIDNIINNFDQTKLTYRRVLVDEGKYGYTANYVYQYDYNGIIISPIKHYVHIRGGDVPPPPSIWLLVYNGEQIRYKLSKKYIKKLYRFFKKNGNPDLYKQNYEDMQRKEKTRKLVMWNRYKDIDPYGEEEWEK